MKRLLILLAMLAAAPAARAGDAFDTPLNQWKISCVVEGGAITRKGDTWTFRPSRDFCGRGSKKMRSELASGRVPGNVRGGYLFHSRIAIRAKNPPNFTLFQVHDKRPGCVGPLMMQVLAGGKIRLVSGIRDKPGKKCTHNVMYSPQKNGGTAAIRLDGTPQDLDILFVFDGRGNIDMTFRLNGTVFARERYIQTSAPGQKPAEVFYFKHGVYSAKTFDFTMTARDVSVRRTDRRF